MSQSESASGLNASVQGSKLMSTPFSQTHRPPASVSTVSRTFVGGKT